MQKGVVFDLFHTLVDPEDFRPPDFTRVEAVSREIGFDVDAFSEFWAATALERTTTPVRVVELVDRFASSNGEALNAQQRLAVDEIMGRYQDLAINQPRPEVSLLITALESNGAKLGLLSNCHEREVRAWSDSPLAPHFDAVGFSYLIGVKKPDPRAYRHVLELLDLPASRCAYAGNGQSDELIGAAEAGFGLVVHYNAFDATNGLVTPSEQRRRAQQANVSTDQADDLAGVLNAFLERGPNHESL